MDYLEPICSQLGSSGEPAALRAVVQPLGAMGFITIVSHLLQNFRLGLLYQSPRVLTAPVFPGFDCPLPLLSAFRVV